MNKKKSRQVSTMILVIVYKITFADKGGLFLINVFIKTEGAVGCQVNSETCRPCALAKCSNSCKNNTNIILYIHFGIFFRKL